MRFIFALLVLAGCSSTPDYQQVFNYCSQNGTNKNVDQVNACINYQSAAMQAKAQRNSAGLAMSAALLSQNRPAPMMTPMPTPVNCVTQRNPFSGQVYTSCR